MSLLNWFAARVVPNSELRVQKQLYQLEQQALVPVEERPFPRPRRKNSKSTIWIKRQVPILPGYVFLGCESDDHFAKTKKMVNDRAGTMLVYGRVGFNGRPARLTEGDLHFLRDLSGLIESRKVTAMVRVGGSLKVVRGLYEGQTGPVLKIGGRESSRVKSMMSLFGRMTVVDLAMADVEAA